MGGVAGTFVGGEAGGNRGVAVEDTEVNFGLREVSVGAIGGGVEDGGVMLRLAEGAVGAQKRGGGGGRIAEAGWIHDGGDAVPLIVFRHQDGADEVLVEFNGKDRVEFVGGAEGQEVETNSVRERDVAVVQVLRGSAEVCQRSRANAVVRGLELACERLRRRDGDVCGRELQRAEAWTRRGQLAAGRRQVFEEERWAGTIRDRGAAPRLRWRCRTEQAEER